MVEIENVATSWFRADVCVNGAWRRSLWAIRVPASESWVRPFRALRRAVTSLRDRWYRSPSSRSPSL